MGTDALSEAASLPDCYLQLLMFPIQEFRKQLSGLSTGSFGCSEFSGYG